MSFWGVHPVTVENMDRVAPVFDVVVGTDGSTTDINAAVAAGHTRIALVPGAALTANLVISASNGVLFSLNARETLDIGAYQLQIAGSKWTLRGLKIDGAAGSYGLSLANTDIWVDQCAVYNCWRGIQNTTASYNVISGCVSKDNGNDGIENAGFHHVLAFNRVIDNGGYGVDDISNGCIVFGNVLTGNGSGAINGTPVVDVGNET